CPTLTMAFGPVWTPLRSGRSLRIFTVAATHLGRSGMVGTEENTLWMNPLFLSQASRQNAGFMSQVFSRKRITSKIAVVPGAPVDLLKPQKNFHAGKPQMKIACTGFLSEQAGSIAAANALLLRTLIERGVEVDFFSKPSFVDPRPVVGGRPGLRFLP